MIWIATLLTALAFADSPIAAPIEGRVLERGTRRPLAEVNVFVLPHELRATTDADGRFRVVVPPGEFQWVVNLTGYRRLEQAGAADPTLYLERESYQVFETTIVGQGQIRDDQRRSIKREQFLQVPGAGGDPVKAVQNLPGINRSSFGSSQVVIQGASPQDTRYLIDGVEVPLIFHFGGFSSVTFPESLDRVDTLSAGYGPEFGRANGGLVGLWTKSPQSDRLHGLAFVDLFNAGALLEGPVGDEGRFSVSLRQSYIGTVLKAALKDEEDFALTVAPTFNDLSLLYERPFNAKTELRLLAIGSTDRLEFLLSEPAMQDPGFRGTFENKTAFYRLIPQLIHRHGSRTVSRLTLGLGKDWISVEIDDQYFRLNNTALSVRQETEHRWSETWVGTFGMDHRINWAQVDINLPVSYNGGGIFNPLAAGTARLATIKAVSHNFGIYSRQEIGVVGTPWTLIPGLRLDRFGRTDEWMLLPRAAAKYRLTDAVTLRAAAGMYAQPATEQQTDSIFGNPNLRSPRAIHAVLGSTQDLRGGRSEGWVFDQDLFYKALSREATPDIQSVYSNDQTGDIFGVQSQARLTKAPWMLNLTYTLSRSLRRTPAQGTFTAPADQTHLFGLVGGVDLPRNWRLGLRFRYATGNPRTPVLGGSYDSDNDVFIPLRGPFYSERSSAFYQLDLRIDKKWIYDNWILSVYLDVQNVTNRANVENVRYSYDFTRSESVKGLPILPTFGLKGEF